MKIAALTQTLNQLAKQGYTSMIGVKLGKYGLMIELEDPNPPEAAPGLVQGTTYLPNGGVIIHHTEGKALLSLNNELIEQIEGENECTATTAHTNAKP